MGRLDNDNWLYPGDSLTSDSGSNEFRMQEDGKIAIYWKGVHLQDDGNFVLYTHDDEAVWASDTCGHGDEVYLAVQDDGNVVLYKGEDDEAEAIWATSTNQI
ncbi:Mannose-specific lectin [Fusarium oxysporum f. sp. raphani]|uniref:Mannose-specific lectin n=1 Tax=Fusarium oxysporum f. sp. raphani TaxID=96318 RepID=A0A8J5UIR2_FUSOX|nr:Mannose-specific lectin [Fusarium oxysporum f. sp. raphani]